MFLLCPLDHVHGHGDVGSDTMRFIGNIRSKNAVPLVGALVVILLIVFLLVLRMTGLPPVVLGILPESMWGLSIRDYAFRFIGFRGKMPYSNGTARFEALLRLGRQEEQHIIRATYFDPHGAARSWVRNGDGVALYFREESGLLHRCTVWKEDRQTQEFSLYPNGEIESYHSTGNEADALSFSVSFFPDGVLRHLESDIDILATGKPVAREVVDYWHTAPPIRQRYRRGADGEMQSIEWFNPRGILESVEEYENGVAVRRQYFDIDGNVVRNLDEEQIREARRREAAGAAVPNVSGFQFPNINQPVPANEF